MAEPKVERRRDMGKRRGGTPACPPAMRERLGGGRKNNARPGTRAGAGGVSGAGASTQRATMPKRTLAWVSHPVMGPGMMPKSTTTTAETTSATSVPQLRSRAWAPSGTGRMNM